MGGSTFPIPAGEGGTKVYYDTIFQLDISSSGYSRWVQLKQKLPQPMAEGTGVQLDKGALLIGGSGPDKLLNKVYQADWDEVNSTIRFKQLPHLPVACSYPAAAVWQGKIYVAGGDGGNGGLHSFISLDPDEKNSTWMNLPAWPGPKRFGAILEVLSDGDQEYLYLFSGKTESTNPRSQDNYLKDAYRFDPISKTWLRLRDMPRAALIGVPGKLNRNMLAIFSGSDGHNIDKLDELGSAYRLPKDILVYDARTDTWRTGGEMPVGLIGVPLLKTDSGFILASGEFSPGLRSAAVYRITVEVED